MKTLAVAIMIAALYGCSPSVRPLYPNTGDVTDDMLSDAAALDLNLSQESTRALATAISQARTYCAEQQRTLQVTAGQADRNNQTPVVYFTCVP